jgi:hypothetical protein
MKRPRDSVSHIAKAAPEGWTSTHDQLKKTGQSLLTYFSSVSDLETARLAGFFA